MRNSSRWAAWLLFICAAVGASTPARATAAEGVQQEVTARLSQGCSGRQFGVGCLVLGTDRRKLYDDIYEYTFQLQVGPGVHDTITLHRVVREDRAYTPSPGNKAVFMVHGDVWGFRGAFLANVESDAAPAQHSLAIYLARRGVDVWGIDLRWVSVPPYVTDFGFMKDWNLGTHAQDVGVGLAVARTVRLLTRLSPGPMPLLGWSRGAAIGYAYLNMESQWSADQRQVSGFIPVDMAYVLAPEAQTERSLACTAYQALAPVYTSGVYQSTLGGLAQAVGAAAKSSPSYASPYLPPFTNQQAAIVLGGATHLLQQPAIFQGYHFTGSTLSGGIPTRLTWTNERFFMDTLEQAAPFQSLAEQVETLALWCGTPNLPYDDHLDKVKVPVFYVGAAGGIGRFGLHTLLKLGSKDIRALIVQRLQNGASAMDYGHQDLFTAGDAEAQVWKPVGDWIFTH